VRFCPRLPTSSPPGPSLPHQWPEGVPPTADTTRNAWLLRLLATAKAHALLVGPSGGGKTAHALHVLGGLGEAYVPLGPLRGASW